MLKQGIYRPQSTDVSVYKEFGLSGLMALSRRCYKLANTLRDPSTYVGTCAVTDMFGNQIDEFVAKENQMEPEP